MAGSALSLFGDILASTGSAIYSGADELVNAVSKNTYLLKRFTMGRDMSEVIQGGKSIKDEIFLTDSSTFQMIQPNEDANWVNPQILSEWEIHWRYGQDHISYVDQEIEHNIGDPNLSAAGRVQVIKRMRRVKETRMWNSLLNGMEDQLFAAPDKTKMESETGKEPYSLPVHMNEQTNTLFNTVTTAGAGGAWTVVQNLDPAALTGWKSQQVAYSNFTVDNSSNVFTAFDKMFWAVHFESPGTKEQYFSDPRLYRQFIACSRDGIVKYQALLRAQNDLLVVTGRQDPAYQHPTYAGIDLVYVSNLDTALLYSKVGATTTLGKETDGDKTGPRYYWCNANAVKIVYHANWYLKRMTEITPERQPNSHITPYQCWYNMVVNDRRKLGIVYPDTDA